MLNGGTFVRVIHEGVITCDLRSRSQKSNSSNRFLATQAQTLTVSLIAKRRAPISNPTVPSVHAEAAAVSSRTAFTLHTVYLYRITGTRTYLWIVKATATHYRTKAHKSIASDVRYGRVQVYWVLEPSAHQTANRKGFPPAMHVHAHCSSTHSLTHPTSQPSPLARFEAIPARDSRRAAYTESSQTASYCRPRTYPENCLHTQAHELSFSAKHARTALTQHSSATTSI
jgi:hypothetical protein